jgi:hypothetical protein
MNEVKKNSILKYLRQEYGRGEISDKYDDILYHHNNNLLCVNFKLGNTIVFMNGEIPQFLVKFFYLSPKELDIVLKMWCVEVFGITHEVDFKLSILIRLVYQ